MSRKLSVVLTDYVRRLGSVGDVVHVAPGYARHFLIPRGFARIATKNIIESIDTHKAVLVKRKEDAFARAASLAKKTDGRFVSFVASCSQAGDLYGSISSRDIRKKLADIMGCDLNELSLDMDRPIKTTGFFSFVCHMGEVSFDVSIIVGSSEEDVDKIRKDSLSNDAVTKES